jgi:hypothetical protein
MTDELNQHFKNTTSDKIITIIKKGEWNDILHGICNIQDNSVYMNYSYFKYFGTKDTYNIVLNYLIHKLDSIKNDYDHFIVYINIKSLTVSEIDKHKDFIQRMANIMNENYPDKLSKCYIYNAPFIFSQLMNIVSLFIDKETQKKIILVPCKI